MFTGLVEAALPVSAVASEGVGLRIELQAPFAAETALGDSIALDGSCLTVVDNRGGRLAFRAGEETLRRTTLGGLGVGDRVNVERAMRADARLGGHFVQGHIDGVGVVKSRQDDGEWSTVWFEVGDLAAQLVEKGSVAVAGVSLTVVEVATDAFSVALVPHTLAVTTLGRVQPGDRVNVETDVLGKYVLKALQAYRR
jgi:riboflavin synthase